MIHVGPDQLHPVKCRLGCCLAPHLIDMRRRALRRLHHRCSRLLRQDNHPTDAGLLVGSKLFPRSKLIISIRSTRPQTMNLRYEVENMAGGGSGTGSKRLMRPDRYSILIFDELSIVSSRGTDGRGVDVDIVANLLVMLSVVSSGNLC